MQLLILLSNKRITSVIRDRMISSLRSVPCTRLEFVQDEAGWHFAYVFRGASKVWRYWPVALLVQLGTKAPKAYLVYGHPCWLVPTIEQTDQ